MSRKSNSSLRKLKDAIKGTEYEDIRIEKVGPGLFELWRGPATGYCYYVCLVGYRFDKWGATHNMEPDKESAKFDSPVSAIRNYVSYAALSR